MLTSQIRLPPLRLVSQSRSRDRFCPPGPTLSSCSIVILTQTLCRSLIRTRLTSMQRFRQLQRSVRTPPEILRLRWPSRVAEPDALLKWFYPGRDTGHEFVYSGQQEKQLAQDTQQTIVANQQPTSDSETNGSGSYKY